MTARFASLPIGPGLAALDGGVTLTTTVNAANLNRTARSDVARSSGVVGAEFTFWGDAALLGAIGVVQAGASLAVMVGADAQGVGWRLDDGKVYVGNSQVASGLPAVAKGDIVGVRVDLDADTVSFYKGSTLVHSRALPVTGSSWHFAVSMGSAVAGELACAVNSGQWQAAGAAAAAGWDVAPPAPLRIRLSDLDWLDEAHSRWEGVVAVQGMQTYAALSFWPWGGNQGAQGGNAQLEVLDPAGVLPADADLAGLPVAVMLADTAGTLAAATPVARFVVDHVEVRDDVRKLLVLRDAHDDLDRPINRGVFLPSIPALAWRPMPAMIGAVASIPVLLANSDGSVGFLADVGLASVTAVYDRGDPLAPGDWSLDPSGQQLLLANTPVGPVTADGSSIGAGPSPATLQQAITDILGRAGVGAVALGDAAAIDAATGYQGIGYYAGDEQTARQALDRLLPSYGASRWQDGAGALRIARVVDPDTVADVDLAFDLTGNDLAADLARVPDEAPNLSRRMAYRPNAYIHGAGDLVTDLVDVPPQRRIELTSPTRGIAYSGAPLAERYRHADTAAAVVSCHWRAEDAQAEIDRVCALYAVPRYFYTAPVVDPDLEVAPGQVGRIAYPQHGMAAGRKLLVVDVLRNPVSGETTLTLWGA